MGRAVALFVAVFLTSFCLIQASRHRSRARLSMEAANTVERENLQTLFAPSIVHSRQYPYSVPPNYVPTIPPAEMTANPKETFSPLPYPTDPCSPSASGVPPCLVVPSPRPAPFPITDSLGYVGAESHLFHKKCNNYCKWNSKRTCWRVKKPRIYHSCKYFTFLGSRFAPSCCFYRHCINSHRPLARSRSWWKHTKALRAMRRACK